MLNKVMNFIHFKDWDTLAYWTTAIATVALVIIAIQANKSWMEQTHFKKKYDIYSELLRSIKLTYRDANTIKNGYPSINDHSTEAIHKRKEWNEFFNKNSLVQFLLGNESFLSDQVYDLIEKFRKANFDPRNNNRNEIERIIVDLEKQVNIELGLK